METFKEDYLETQKFIKEYGLILNKDNKLSVSYSEISEDGESILSWHNEEAKSLKSIIAVNDEGVYEIQVIEVLNGKLIKNEILLSLEELKHHIETW